ncbi:hypothetical protein K431DRAFT_334029 [Polychaeton citri CBS 116435]|uniref:Integral membrane protein n=1 Tax=Polychaeton citri CBS 116435 TaxID=1314669 RepID=A0A9P4Q0G2_9PEZI|nr:hypothetical protein K431DRAFT_334029 [Polychaeton citri CBS 116435]
MRQGVTQISCVSGKKRPAMDSPIVKATLQAAALSALSNILGQLIACYRSKVQKQSISNNLSELTCSSILFHFVLFAAFSCPPNFIWQAWLETQYPGSTPRLEKGKEADLSCSGDEAARKASGSQKISVTSKSSLIPRSTDEKGQNPACAFGQDGRMKLNVKNTAVKFALDQSLGAAVNTIMFIAGMGLIAGEPLQQIQNEVYEGFLPLMLAGGKLWPLVSVISFTLIPVEHRMVFGSMIGVGWGIFLSLVSGGKVE